MYMYIPCSLALVAHTDHSECPRDGKSDRWSLWLCTVHWDEISQPEQYLLLTFKISDKIKSGIQTDDNITLLSYATHGGILSKINVSVCLEKSKYYCDIIMWQSQQCLWGDNTRIFHAHPRDETMKV